MVPPRIHIPDEPSSNPKLLLAVQSHLEDGLKRTPETLHIENQADRLRAARRVHADRAALHGVLSLARKAWGEDVGGAINRSTEGSVTLELVRGSIVLGRVQVEKSTWGFRSNELSVHELDLALRTTRSDDKRRSVGGWFSPSQFDVYPCAARQAYQYSGTERREAPIPLPLAKAFAAGTATHKEFDILLERAFGEDAFPNLFIEDKPSRFWGSIDGLVLINWKPVLIEAKSQASGLFHQRRRGPDPKWAVQAETYQGMMGCEDGVVVVINKNDWSMKFHPTKLGARWSARKRRAEAIAKMVENGQEVPKTPGEYCRHCPYIWTCQPQSLL